MRLQGWCTGCSRVRRVTVTPSGLATRVGQVVTGRCDDCEERDRWRGRTVTLHNRQTRETAHVRVTTASTQSFEGVEDATSGLRQFAVFPRPLWGPA